MRLTDTHCHLDYEKFSPDRAEVLQRAWEAGLEKILIPGLNLESSHAALALAERDPRLFAAVGIHPSDALTWQENSLAALREMAQSNRVKAIGEIGLDYYWDDAPHPLQHSILQAQLQLAEELRLPVILHLREAADAPEGSCSQDLLAILRPWAQRLQAQNNPLAQRPGVFHSFSGSAEVARQALALGFYIGISGPITYKNAETKRQILANLPQEKILLETDSPFLAPTPQRGKRNEPAFVRHIADKIAEIHQQNPEETAAQTYQNAARLFAWEE
jgi:TatD DNase family protein